MVSHALHITCHIHSLCAILTAYGILRGALRAASEWSKAAGLPWFIQFSAGIPYRLIYRRRPVPPDPKDQLQGFDNGKIRSNEIGSELPHHWVLVKAAEAQASFIRSTSSSRPRRRGPGCNLTGSLSGTRTLPRMILEMSSAWTTICGFQRDQHGKCGRDR